MPKIKQIYCLCAAAVFAACMLACSDVGAQAADLTAITNQLWTVKDRLIAEKQRLTVIRQKVQFNWNEWDYVLRQTETALRWNPVNKNQLLAQRSIRFP